MKFDEAAVERCYVLQQWVPIFSDENQLASLSSGVVNPDDVNSDLLEAKAIGMEKSRVHRKQNQIQQNWLLRSNKTNKLKTFSTMRSSKSVNVKGKDCIVRADRDLFARLLIIRENVA